MAITVEGIPEELKERGQKLREEPEDAETRQLLQRMIDNLKLEQTSKSLMNTLIMTDLTTTEFFDILRSNLVKGGARLMTLLDTNWQHDFRHATWRLERAGFIGIQEKLWCQGCGGVVMNMPEFCTLTLIHTWMNPLCPALIGLRDPQRSVRGTEVMKQPELNRPLIKDNLKELFESDFHMYEESMINPQARAESWGNYFDGSPIEEKNRMVVAGWYGQEHPSGKKARCFCCGVEKKTWRMDDCPLLAHLKESPRCPYLHAIMEQEEIIGLLSGHRESISKDPRRDINAYDYFKKVIFSPKAVNHERIKWDERSTNLQRQSDNNKEKLISEWIMHQRIHDAPPTEPEPKRGRMVMTRKTLMNNYQWATRRIDINTRVQGLDVSSQEEFQYTPNWARDEKFLQGWGLLFPYNRDVTLKNAHLILE